MAIKKTRQRQRGGPYSKFDKTKTLPREFQIVESGDPNSKDGRAVYIAFEAGEPKRLSTYEDMQEDIDNATEEIQGTLTSGVDKKIKEADAAITSAKSAATKANTATTNANTATDSANKAADNANKAVENIQSKVAINDKQPSATTAYSGNKIETEFLKKNGDSSETTVTFEVATQRANIQPQDTLEIAFGKLAKFCGDLKSHAFAAPVNNLAGTNPDLALAAPMGKELKGEIDALNSTLTNYTPMYFSSNPIAFSIFMNKIFSINSLAVNFKVQPNGWCPDKNGNWMRGTVYIQNTSLDFQTVGDIIAFTETAVFVGKIFVSNGNIGIKRWYKISDTFQ